MVIRSPDHRMIPRIVIICMLLFLLLVYSNFAYVCVIVGSDTDTSIIGIQFFQFLAVSSISSPINQSWWNLIYTSICTSKNHSAVAGFVFSFLPTKSLMSSTIYFQIRPISCPPVIQPNLKEYNQQLPDPILCLTDGSKLGDWITWALSRFLYKTFEHAGSIVLLHGQLFSDGEYEEKFFLARTVSHGCILLGSILGTA